MNKIKRRWCALGATILGFSLAVAYLSRPIDEFGILRSFQPRSEQMRQPHYRAGKSWIIEFEGHDKVQAILGSLPVPQNESYYKASFPSKAPWGIITRAKLPSGNDFSLHRWDYTLFEVEVCEEHPSPPWFVKAWRTIKQRLGV